MHASDSLRICLGAVTLGAACVPAKATSRPAVFGNEGAVIQAKASTQPTAMGSCGEVKPAGTRALVDDFEDGDGQAFKVTGREGWWWSSSDDTPNARLLPAAGAFRPERLPDDEVSRKSAYAAHLAGAGQTGWGAAWGTSLRWVGEGRECPFNASRFAGLRLRARGTGDVKLMLPTPPTVPLQEEFGECEKQCWDSYGYTLHLRPEWQEFVVPFSQLQQGGWGHEAEFDPRRLLGVNFTVGPGALPVDFWIDDLAFVTAAEIDAWYAAAPSPVAAQREP